jgi:hypothetical protein
MVSIKNLNLIIRSVDLQKQEEKKADTIRKRNKPEQKQLNLVDPRESTGLTKANQKQGHRCGT